jgi:acetyltransferase-like isoleucine patch superfamily enzyme
MLRNLILFFTKYKLPKKILLKLLKEKQFESSILRSIYKKNYNIEVGMYSYGCFNYPDIPINTKIGRYCSFGTGVKIFNANHPSEYIFLHPYMYNISLGFVNQEPFQRTELTIGNDVWIGANALIMPSVQKIGNGVVIGVGSIVTKDIPDFAVVVGNPAKIIKYRFNEETRKKILQMNIYSISKDEFKSNINYFYSEEEFQNYVTKGLK